MFQLNISRVMVAIFSVPVGYPGESHGETSRPMPNAIATNSLTIGRVIRLPGWIEGKNRELSLRSVHCLGRLGAATTEAGGGEGHCIRLDYD